MKKLIVLLFLITLTGCKLDSYSLKVPENVYFNQDNYFDVYEGVEVTNASIDDVVVYGVELLGLTEGTKGRITEFGSFTLRYCLIIEEELITQEYKTIVVTYKPKLNGLLYNTDFLGGLKSWGIVDWKNSLDVSIEDDMLKINQKSVDQDIWDQSLYQYVNNLEINKKYLISFDAKSTSNKTIKVCLAQTFPVYPYSYNITNEVDININNTMNTYEIEFTSTYPSNIEDGFEFNLNLVRLEFKFGKYNNLNNEISTIYFDNIFIKEVK